jgi:hypothetical protein
MQKPHAERLLKKLDAERLLQELHAEIFFLKELTVLRGPLAYPNGLLDLHIETFGRTP